MKQLSRESHAYTGSVAGIAAMLPELYPAKTFPTD